MKTRRMVGEGGRSAVRGDTCLSQRLQVSLARRSPVNVLSKPSS
jgi:hypothetical protein